MSEAIELEKTQVVPQLVRLATSGEPPPLRFASGSASPAGDLWLWFRDGFLVDALSSGSPSLLETAAYATGKLTEKERKRFEKQARQDGRDAGALALSQGAIPAEELAPAVLAAIEDRLGALIAAPDVEILAAEGEHEPPLPRGVAELFQLEIPLDALMRGAARTAGRWDVIRDHVPALREVYYATPTAMAYMSAPQDYPLHAAILQELDGVRDVAEAIDAANVDPFGCWQALDELVAGGQVQAINPVQLFQLGNDCEHRGDYGKALRLFERAEQRGLDDFDLGFRLGELYERTGQRELAVDRFLTVTEKCFSQFRIEDTIRCCRKILALDPENTPIQDRYVSLLARYGKGEEAISAGLSVAQRLRQSGDLRRAQSTLEKIVDLAEANEEVLRCYLDLCEKNGHETGAAKARRSLAHLFHQREETGKALELYQGLFVSGEDSAEVRQRLAELHFRTGNAAQAVQHLQALERVDGWSPREPHPEAVAFFRKLLASGVRAPEVTAWLADEARLRGDRTEMLSLLDRHRQALEAAGNLEEALKCAEQLVRQAPRSVDHARTLSSLKKRCGDIGGAAAVLEQLAERLAGDPSSARDVETLLADLIALNPLSLRGRRLLLTHGAKQRDVAAQQRLQLETALLSLASGEAARAHAHLEGLACAPVLATAFDWISGLLALASSEKDKALSHFTAAARRAAEQGERATLGALIDQLRAFEPRLP
ncbi:MAG: hypothetical protein L0Z55_10685, partial [Planctomycetes bacterium]|nr:hypothetical protein [Planctomycetota bacterium]